MNGTIPRNGAAAFDDRAFDRVQGIAGRGLRHARPGARPDFCGSPATTPSARNPNYGLGLWLGSPYVAKRPYFEGQPGAIPQSEPFLADDVRIMEGGGFRVTFVVPSRELVILRLGEQVGDWDHAALVNTIIRGIDRR